MMNEAISSPKPSRSEVSGSATDWRRGQKGGADHHRGRFHAEIEVVGPARASAILRAM